MSSYSPIRFCLSLVANDPASGTERESAMGKNVIVGPHKGGGWQAKKAGNSKASATGETQGQMIERGIELAKNEGAELIVQNRHGVIREKNSYGNDPPERKG